MIRKQRVSPTEIESREDSLAEGEELADHETLDIGLKSIASTLRAVIIVGLAVILSFAGLGVLYVLHENAQERDARRQSAKTSEGICDVVTEVTRQQVSGLIAAASADGTPPSDEVIAIYIEPIEAAIARCYEQIPTVE